MQSKKSPYFVGKFKFLYFCFVLQTGYEKIWTFSQTFSYSFTPQILILTHQQQTAFENIVGKEEIAHIEQFLLYAQCFLLSQKFVSPFVNIFDIISLFASELKEPKVGVWGKELARAVT